MQILKINERLIFYVRLCNNVKKIWKKEKRNAKFYATKMIGGKFDKIFKNWKKNLIFKNFFFFSFNPSYFYNTLNTNYFLSKI